MEKIIKKKKPTKMGISYSLIATSGSELVMVMVVTIKA
jgi:hypothetical protein